MQDAYDSLRTSRRIYRISPLRFYTLRMLVDKYYPFDQSLMERLTDADEQLYNEYDHSRKQYEDFDISECTLECRNNTKTNPCATCSSDYLSGVYENANKITQGVQYLMGVWNDETRNSTVFPFKETDFAEVDANQNVKINLALRDSLGTPMFNFLYEAVKANNTSVTSLSNWGNMGGNCETCSPPHKTGCTEVTPFDVSQIPSVVIPLLENENKNCITNFWACDSMTSLDPAVQRAYLTRKNISNCITALGDASNYESKAAYDAEVVKCQNYSASFNGLPDYPDREGIVRPVVQSLYPSAAQVDTVEKIVPNLIEQTKNQTLGELQKYMIQYEAEQKCRLSCKADFEAAFASHITDIIENKQDEIREKYIAQCFGKLDEMMDISYPYQFYQYTLYHYDAAGHLKATTPPEGVDLVDIYASDPTQSGRKPAHRMQSVYEYNSLYNTASASPDEGRTEFLYDKAGRVRFSQNAQQRTLLDQQILNFSYTKYDEETGRITETGEYKNAIDTLVAGFTVNEGQTAKVTVPATAASQVDSYAWPSMEGREQFQTYMVYDQPTLTLDGYAQMFTDHRLSKTYNSDGTIYYSYDAQGRVNFMVQEIPALGEGKYKTVDYYYLPLTGKVDSVVYQKNTPAESFRHRYKYDDDNRLAQVNVSRDGKTWLNAAKYEYYLHGPLKSMQLGDSVQKVDYVYTINGWLKAINNPLAGNTSDNSGIGRDAFAQAINYFRGDYLRSGTGFEAGTDVTLPGSDGLAAQAKDLYSGNINSIVTRTGFDMVSGGINPLMAQAYHYDVLNRIKDAYTLTPTNAAGLSGTPDNSWYMHLDYDANGNIERLTRKRNSNLGMDELTYRYALGTDNEKTANRLLHINDSEAAVEGLTDIKDQGIFNQANPASWNYSYDARGRMTGNRAEGLAAITWSPYDKVLKVNPVEGTNKPTIEFAYNPKGLRMSKKVSFTNGNIDETFYVYDASDNMLATYSRNQVAGSTAKIALSEYYLYGTKRLGDYLANIDLSSTVLQNIDKKQLRYELTDHLGNVRAVVSGQSPVNGIPVLVAGIDYYPFGMEMPQRSFSSPRYRFGYNGQEKDDDIYGISGSLYTAQFWEYDSRIGRRWNLEPKSSQYPYLGPYTVFENNPIYFNDKNGLDAEYTIKNNTITFKAKIVIVGEGATSANAKEMKKQIMTKFTGKTFVATDGTKYNVKFDISVVAAEKAGTITKSTNVVRLKDASSELRSWVKGWYGLWSKNDQSAYSHETGHFVGLADRYIELDHKGSNLPGDNDTKYSTNVGNTDKDELMGMNASKKSAKITQKDINALAEYALKNNKDGIGFIKTGEVNKPTNDEIQSVKISTSDKVVEADPKSLVK